MFVSLLLPFHWVQWMSVCVCKDATSGTKANNKADVPNEENMAREAGMIQLVSGKVSVLYAYIIQGGVWIDYMRWQAQVGCFVADTVFPLLLKNLHYQMFRTPGQKLFVRLPFTSRQLSVLCSSDSAGVFSVHGTGWWTENTAGAGHCNVLQCSLLCYAHPLCSILALPLTISQSLALSRSLSCPYLYHLSRLPLSTVFSVLLSPCPFYSSLLKLTVILSLIFFI